MTPRPAASSTGSSSTGWSEGIDISVLPPHELLDDGFAPEPCDLLVIGCGNILRGDDAVGPVLIRHLYERGVPAGVRLVDGGTAGMDVAFAMRGAARVVIVDASATGAEPGTVYRVPVEELTDLPPIDGLHTHNFRWDHALSFSTWLLGPARPSDVTVFLVEAESLEPGAALSAAVDQGMRTVLDLLERDFLTEPTEPGEGEPGSPEPGSPEPGVPEPGEPAMSVEITESGYLHLPAALAASYVPSDALVARRESSDAGDTLVLVPLVSLTNGGLVLKQRNSAGDRSLLVNEVLGFEAVVGRFEMTWDADRGALVVPLRTEVSDAGSADRSGGRGGAMGGLSGGAQRRGSGAAPGREPLQRAASTVGGRRDPAYGGTPAPAGGGL